MKATTLLKIAAIVLLFVAAFVGDSFAQQTYYVNAKNGLDGWDGSSPTYVGPGVGPKKTMNNAILNASTGDIISADYAEGNLYNENVIITKALTIVSTNGTPQVVSWDVQASITVTAPFRLNTGLMLTAGLLTGASNITVGGQVTRTAGSVDSQLNYLGVVNFVYNGGAGVAPMTTGLELPPASNTANFGNLTTTAGTDIALNEDKVMNGVLNTAAKINLNTHTLYLVNSTVATVHAVGGDITNGSMDFTLNSNSTVNGLFILPHVKVMSSNSLLSLTISNAINFEGLTNSGLAAIIVNHDNAITVGILDLRAGKIQIWTSPAAAGDVTVTGNASFIGGTFDMGTTAARTLHLKGAVNVFSSASGRTDFSSAGMRNVTLMFSAAATAQNVTGNQIETIWFGILDVNNTSGFTPAVTFQGGDFRILDDLLFTSGRVKIIDKKLIVGGRLAPYNNTVPGTAEFTNTAGYTTEGNGFVSMNSDLNSQISGPGSFANFEVDMTGLNLNVLAATGPMTAQFNLAKGQVTSSANVNFNFAVPPVIVRNEGTFDAAPTFTTQVDVIYINKDKFTGFEIPASPAFADKLRNLSVLTTNGTLVAGKGTIEVPPATPLTVNGTLTVNSGQTLLLNGSSLTMKGSTIVLNGDIANDMPGAGTLILDNPTGTAINASSILPDLVVNDASVGNTITGTSVTFARGLLGPNNLKGGGDDINPGNTGGISFFGGMSGSSLSLNLGTADPVSGFHLNYVTTAAGANLILLNHLIQSGDLTHQAGTINVNTFTYTHYGVNPQFWGQATTTGSGKILFAGAPKTIDLNLVVSNAPIINANVEINLNAPGDLFILNPATTQGLWIRGNLTLTQGTIQLGDGSTARDLTLWGSNFIVGANGSINTVGIGTLYLDAANPPLNVWLGGNRDLGNVTVDNSVVLDPTSPGLALGITGLFMHRNGQLDFNTRNITIKPTGNYTRTGGTYAATTGYLIIQTPLFDQGTTDFTIPNLRINVAASFGVANSAYFTVLTAFDLYNGVGNIFTHTFGGVPRLKIADGATVNYRDGNLDVVATYLGSIDLNSLQVVNIGLPANIWPGLPTTLVNHFNSWGLGGTTVTLPGTRTVNTILTLTSGNTAVLGGANLHIEDNAVINVIRGILTVVGTRTFGNDIDVFYKNDGVGAYNTGFELPGVVNNLTFTRIINAINQFTVVNTPVMVNGTLTMRNNVQTQAAPTVPVNATISTYGDVVVENESSTFPLATDPVTIFNAPLEFNGGVDQDLIVPSAGVDLTNGGVAAANIRINKDNPTDAVNLVGGNLITGTVFFVNGILVTGDNILTIPAPVPGGGQGFSRIGVTGPNASHVIGRVRKVFVNGGTIATSTNERSEFPVGTNPKYRPVAVTFKPAFGFPTVPNALAVTVSHIDERPTGTIGLPIEDGVGPGVDVVDYPDFHWQVWTNQNLSQYTFDLELRADGFADYDTVSNLRIIRRHGDLRDVANEWRLQGSIADYDNAQYQGDPSKPVVINQNSLGGLRVEGALFTLGLKSAKQEFYNPVWLPGNPFRAMTIFCTRADIAGIPMNVGDEIGVFDGDLCVGAVALNGAATLADPIQIICSAKEEGLDNGFTDGNPIVFRVWDASAGLEYNTSAQYYDPGTGAPIAPVPFEGLGTAAVQLDDNGINAEPQAISLNEGWNMFSLGVVPTNGPDMLDILNPILGDLDKVLDETGNSIVNLFGTWQNSIGDWSETEGYYIKMKRTTTLNVEGTAVTVPLCIDLTSGWNIISYPCITYTQDALAVFQSLIDNTQLVKVVDEGGNSIFKLFGTWLNSIGDLQPGEAYYVKVNTNTQVCIDCPGQAALPKAADNLKQMIKPAHFTTPATGNPYQPMTVYVTESVVNGETLVEGDEIALYDGSQCVGVAVINAAVNKQAPLEIITSKDDGNGIGFKDGNPMSFKVWKKATNEELTIEFKDVTFLTLDETGTRSANRFEGLGTAAVAINSFESQTSESLVPVDFQLDQNYPNPFNPTTMISYALPKTARVKLDIYNLNGNLVKTLFNGEQSKGRHVVEWDGNNDVGMKVASGIYIYKMRADNFVSTKKMVLSK